MKLSVTIFIITLCLISCKKKATSTIEKNKDNFEVKIESSEKFDFSKVPDSLELVPNKSLTGDFDGDNKMDIASIVKNKSNFKQGVLIQHCSNSQENIVFGAGQEIDNMTDLSWIETFALIPKGNIVAPTLVDHETGDIIGKDKSKNFKLIGDGIRMSVIEYHGGGIIFWNGQDYQWYHIE